MKNDENEQYYYDLEKINVSGVPKIIITTSKKKFRVDYNLEKINVEWSGPLTTVSPKINTTSKK